MAVLCLVLSCGSVGCNGIGANGSAPPVVSAAAESAEVPVKPVKPASGPLDLRTAVAYSLQYHPELAVFPLQQRVSDARILLAGLRPNPALAVEVEDFGGSREFSGTGSAQITASIVQQFELGGKAAARRALARAEADTQMGEYEVKRRELIAETAKRFIEALAAAASLELAEEELQLARESAASVRTQMDAGRATGPELRQAELAVSAAELQVRQARRGADGATAALRALWGGAASASVRPVGSLEYPPVRLPAASSLRASVEGHPAVRGARTREREAQAALQLAQANRMPDLEISAGVRQDNASDSQGGVIAVSLPLPFNQSRSGAIREAEAMLEKSRHEAAAGKARLAAEFDMAWTELANAHDAALTARNQLLPGTRQVFDDIRESYNLGRGSYLELLAARRELAAARRTELEARKNYRQAAARIEALTGQPMP
jgi:cobalt-zinc-cadmium efflux system outer membrane protein